MRCPKCHYLSFDPEPRCKNCGYDLEVADADLALRTTESVDEQNGAEDLPELTLRAPERAAAPIGVRNIPQQLARPAGKRFSPARAIPP